jgi:hypothetical protein
MLLACRTKTWRYDRGHEQRTAYLREVLRIVTKEVEARFGEQGLAYLEVATETPIEQAAS